MKREFPQKVRFVPSPSSEKEALVKFSACKLGLFRQAHPEGNRRVRTSAAMIGLAISMGASSLFLPRQGDRAFASEPIKAEPTAKSAISSLDQTAWLPVTHEVTPAAQTVIAIPEANALPRHAEQEDSRLLPLSPKVDSTEIALPAVANEPSYSISSKPVLLAEPKLDTPEARSFEDFQVVSPANTLVVPLAVNSSITDDVNEVFKAKQEVFKANQDVAIKDLQRSSNRLKNGLAELRSEESASSSKEVTEPGQNPSVANPITNFSYPSVSTDREVLVPIVPEASPEAEFKSVPLIGQTSETAGVPNPAFVPLVPDARPEVANKNVPLIVPTAETAVETVPEAASPLEDKQTAFTPSEGVEVPDMSQAVVIATEDRQTVVIPSNAVREAKANVYRVNSGDTVGVIAQNYGVSQSELVHANELSDPNFINVDQTLKIPVADAGKPLAQTMTLISNSNVAPEAAYNPAANIELIEEKQVPNLVIPQPASALNPTLPLVIPGTPESIGSFSSSMEFKPDESAEMAVVPVQPNQSLESEVNHKSNPYVEGLRAEVLKLREKYQTQKVSNQGNAAITTPTPVVPSVMNLSVPAREISNPEFNPAQSRESLQAQVSQQARLGTRSGQVTQPAPQQAPIVATAPIGADAYDQGIQPRMVSPDLPPLAPAERYLPNGAASFNGYIWPAKGEFTSGYGWRWGRMHAGIDVAGPIGTPIVAAAPGVVTYAEWNEGGYGNLVEIQHPDGSLTLYAHNDRILVREGQQVDQGQQIAEMGSTGFSTGPHVHFELHRRGQGAIDPIAMLPR